MALIEVEGSLISASAVSPSQGISERDERERERERDAGRQTERQHVAGCSFVLGRGRRGRERKKLTFMISTVAGVLQH